MRLGNRVRTLERVMFERWIKGLSDDQLEELECADPVA